MQNIENILIIIVTRIGDTALITPVLKSISLYFPDSKITVMAHPKRASILRNLPFIYEVKGITKKSAPFKGWLMTRKFDLSFVYEYDIELMRYSFRVSKKTIAFTQKSEKINRQLYKHIDPVSEKYVTQINRLMLLPGLLDIPLKSKQIQYKVSSLESENALKFLKANNISRKFLIGFQAVSFPTKSFRDWPIENFFHLAQNLQKKNPECFFIIFGGNDPNEREKNQWLDDVLGNNSLNISGLSLRETAAIMNNLNLYVGVDTGPSHIMSAFKIPTVVLYHNTFPSDYFGLDQHNLFKAIDHPKIQSQNEESMKDITIQKVYTEITTLMSY